MHELPSRVGTPTRCQAARGTAELGQAPAGLPPTASVGGCSRRVVIGLAAGGAEPSGSGTYKRVLGATGLTVMAPFADGRERMGLCVPYRTLATPGAADGMHDQGLAFRSRSVTPGRRRAVAGGCNRRIWRVLNPQLQRRAIRRSFAGHRPTRIPRAELTTRETDRPTEIDLTNARRTMSPSRRHTHSPWIINPLSDSFDKVPHVPGTRYDVGRVGPRAQPDEHLCNPGLLVRDAKLLQPLL